MQFIHLQLQFDSQQLTLSIQTHQDTQYFQLQSPVADPQELAHQAELFISIHLRPYFDRLPVESCQASVAPEVPELMRDSCLGELIKFTKTNDVLTRYAQVFRAAAEKCRLADNSLKRLCVFSAETPTEALASFAVLAKEPDTLCLAYLPDVKVNHDQSENLKLFTHDIDAWVEWYAALGVQQLICSAEFVREFERFGVVLSSIVTALGQALVIIDPAHSLGRPMNQYEKRATDSHSVVRYQMDEKSLVWARWLGITNPRLGPLSNIACGLGGRAIANAFREEQWESLNLAEPKLRAPIQETDDNGLSLVVCEDLYLRRLGVWAPQAYFVKKLLDQHCNGVASTLVLVELWAGVMRRLIVSSEQTTDYDVVVLVRRLELIADAVKNLSLIEFIQEIQNKVKVQLYGHSNWSKLFPKLWSSGYEANQWREAAKAHPGSALLNVEPVFNPCLSERCIEAVVSGRPAAYFSMYHQLCEPRIDLHDDLALDWLAQQNIMNVETCCVHLMSAASHRESMITKRQGVLDQLNQHNQQVYDQIKSATWQAGQSALCQSVDAQLEQWHECIAEFYDEHAIVFNESLMVLNPSVEMGVTDELRASAPDYLAVVLDVIAKDQLDQKASA